MYEFLGISLVLAALLTVNALFSLAVAACWRVLEGPTRHWSARTRAEVLFGMRVGPPAIALLSVALLLIPSYLAYEPYSTSEVVSKKLGALAFLSAVGVALALWRGLHSWLATHALQRKWLDASEPIRLPQTRIPTFRIRHPFPVIAVVGTLRPRLFIAGNVLESLSKEELIAAIAHESGHLAEHDNLKRMLIRACRDMLAIVPVGGSIDRAWAANAESAADEHAAGRGSAVALNLASALIKIARMAPAGARPTMPVAAFLLGDEANGVMARVNRLIRLAMDDENQESRFSSSVLWCGRIGAIALPAIVLAVLVHSNALAALHAAMEKVVQLLT
jgi:Zn-dependent protease with chaperone function